MTIIAKVRVVTHDGGKRLEYLPGEEVPGLSQHDLEQLMASGSVEDTERTAAQERRDAEDEREASRAFEQARAGVIAARQSTQAESLSAASDADTGAGVGTGAGTDSGTGTGTDTDTDSAGAVAVASSTGRPAAQVPAAKKSTGARSGRR